jgi:hypothetical protein
VILTFSRPPFFKQNEIYRCAEAGAFSLQCCHSNRWLRATVHRRVVLNALFCHCCTLTFSELYKFIYNYSLCVIAYKQYSFNHREKGWVNKFWVSKRLGKWITKQLKRWVMIFHSKAWLTQILKTIKQCQHLYVNTICDHFPICQEANSHCLFIALKIPLFSMPPMQSFIIFTYLDR